MMADYRAYAHANGVLEMPAGYTADKQINLYAMRQQGWKQLTQLGLWAAGSLALILLPVWLVWRRRRRSRRVD